VMVLFAMATLGMLAVLSRYVFDAATAVVAVSLLLVFPTGSSDVSGSFIGLGRMVLGEVPALLFLLVGVLTWFTGLGRTRNMLPVIAGICFGLAAVTKPQALLILVAMGGIWLVDLWWYQQLRKRDVVIPVVVAVACVLSWTLLPWFLDGGVADAAGQDGTRTRALMLPLAALSSPRLMLRNLGALSAAGALTWGLPGLVYGAYLSRERNRTGLKRAFLLIAVVTWLGWFVMGSVGWLRYAVIGIAFMTLPTARLLVDLAGGNTGGEAPPRGGDPSGPGAAAFRRAAVMIAVVLMVAIPLQRTVRKALGEGDATAAEFAGDLDRIVSTGERVESFEPEIVFLSAREFSQPSLDVLMQSVRYAWLRTSDTPARYTPDSQSAYLVHGPMSKQTAIYRRYLDDGCCRLVHQVGDYELYQVTSARDATESTAPSTP
jgi:hypothetical protein